MKKLFILLLFGLFGFCAMCFNMACNTQSPSSPNFQSPLQTIVAINPTFTGTSTATFTFTPTITATPTPYVSAAPWAGFSNPQAIANYNNSVNGGLFVADTGHNQVKKYTVNGNLVATWGEGGKGKGIISVNSPQGVAVDGSGSLYVVGGISGINKYDVSGNLTNQFISVIFTNPQGIAVDGSGHIFVSDTANNRIVKLNSNGTLGSGFGANGVVTISPIGPSTQASPYGIAIDNNGNVAAAVADNNIHLYDSSGSVITTIPGNVNSAFSVPRGVAFEGNNLFVADTGYHQAEEFANWGLNLSPIVIFNGNGSLNSPTGVAVDANGNIYVTDSTNNYVVKFLP